MLDMSTYARSLGLGAPTLLILKREHWACNWCRATADVDVKMVMNCGCSLQLLCQNFAAETSVVDSCCFGNVGEDEKSKGVCTVEWQMQNSQICNSANRSPSCKFRATPNDFCKHCLMLWITLGSFLTSKHPPKVTAYLLVSTQVVL